MIYLFLQIDCNLFWYHLINLISIPGDTDQTEEKLETAEVERRSTAETELDLPTESLGKIVVYIKTIKNCYQLKIYYRDRCSQI